MKRTKSETTQQLVPAGSMARLRPMPVTVSGVSCVSATWIAFTFLSFAGLVVAAVFPYWASNYNRPSNFTAHFSRVDLGIYHFCVDASNAFADSNCSTYLRYSPSQYVTTSSNLQKVSLNDFAFFVAFGVVYGVGGALVLLSSLCGLAALCKPKLGKSCSVFLFAFFIQVLADICLVVALAIFPLSFKSEFLQQFCGAEAHFYNKGYCSLGWPLYTAMVATSFALYLPALAIFSMNISDGLRGNICC